MACRLIIYTDPVRSNPAISDAENADIKQKLGQPRGAVAIQSAVVSQEPKAFKARNHSLPQLIDIGTLHITYTVKVLGIYIYTCCARHGRQTLKGDCMYVPTRTLAVPYPGTNF